LPEASGNLRPTHDKSRDHRLSSSSETARVLRGNEETRAVAILSGSQELEILRQTSVPE